MSKVAIVGDGPGGLSAALFLAKNDHQVAVFGTDETAMHYAHLHNYLGLPEIAGSEFQQIARNQASSFGAELIDQRVTAVSVADGISVTTESGSNRADYLILTEGKNPELAIGLGVETDETGGVVVDRSGRTSIDKVYVIGRSARPTRSQAIISAGDGASAALDILAIEEGKDVQDWDSPPKE